MQRRLKRLYVLVEHIIRKMRRGGKRKQHRQDTNDSKRRSGYRDSPDLLLGCPTTMGTCHASPIKKCFRARCEFVRACACAHATSTTSLVGGLTSQDVKAANMNATQGRQAQKRQKTESVGMKRPTTKQKEVLYGMTGTMCKFSKQNIITFCWRSNINNNIDTHDDNFTSKTNSNLKIHQVSTTVDHISQT